MRVALLAAAVMCAAPGLARAEAPRFLGEVDRQQVGLGESFLYQVTLSAGDVKVSDYHAPDFKGFKVLATPSAPSQSTQMQIGGGGTYIAVSYTWRYELAATQKGRVNIGPARVKVNGDEFRSSVVSIVVGSAAAPATPPPLANGPGGPSGSPAEAGEGGSFIRLVTDKTKAYVGEAIAATWFLYMNQPADKYDTQVEPTMEGFWTEDVALPNRRGGMILNDELVQGRRYQVGPALRKALFPLHPGKLTITPMEAQLSRVDFFGTPVRSQHVRSTPTVIEVLPLPKEGQPAGFDAANVGTFTFTRRVDRTQVAVGEAVTLTLEIGGHGNIRNVAPPALAKPDGFKVYDPRITVNVDPGNGVEGTKLAEILLLPERPGAATLPAQRLDFFDPATGRYTNVEVPAIALTVTGTANGNVAAAGAAPAKDGAASPTENVIGGEIRPIHARARLRQDLASSLLQPRTLLGLVLGPPLLFGLAVFGLRLRDRLNQETGATRRRRSRQKVRAHFAAAEACRQRRDVGAFYIEIDRVIRETLSHRLGVAVAGLRMDELRARLATSGLPAADAERVVVTLEECDQARFAPGSVPGDDAALGAAIDRAAELTAAIEGMKPAAGGAS
jgi:hypothetical protein